METDALEIAKSLPDFAEFIQGIVPQFGGKCFDITLTTAEAAVQLSTAGYDHGEIRKPLRLLGVKSIHVSVFVSVEFPDEDLIAILEQYGDLKTRKLRRLYFSEEGFPYIERGVRVAEFNKITRDIPKKVVFGGIEIGFKYSGQPATCYRCQSTEHVVKDCPKRRRTPPRWNENPQPEGGDPAHQPESDPNASGEGMDTSPSLFTQPGTATYASAATGTADSSETRMVQPPRQYDFLNPSPREDDGALNTSRGRKRDNPSPSGSDDERGAPSKKPVAASASPESENTVSDTATNPPVPEASNSETDLPFQDAQEVQEPSQPISPPSGQGFKNFITALSDKGSNRTNFMAKAPANVFYRCRGYYLYHKYGKFTDAKGRKYKVSVVTANTWENLQGTVSQDAFAKLLELFKEVREAYKLFQDN